MNIIYNNNMNTVIRIEYDISKQCTEKVVKSPWYVRNKITPHGIRIHQLVCKFRKI